jgi:hypothetical protein
LRRFRSGLHGFGKSLHFEVLDKVNPQIDHILHATSKTK